MHVGQSKIATVGGCAKQYFPVESLQTIAKYEIPAVNRETVRFLLFVLLLVFCQRYTYNIVVQSSAPVSDPPGLLMSPQPFKSISYHLD